MVYIMAILFALSLSLIAGQKQAHAGVNFPALYTVNQTGDTSDADSNDFHCDVLPNFAGQQCTLRAAIQQSNHTPGPAIIHFDLPGDGVHTISPNTELPGITDTVTIDGYSQPGSTPNTLAKATNARLMIELDGSQVRSGSFADGLLVDAPDVVVKGLVVSTASPAMALS
jgi:CSLREA domain-containing protein